MSNFIEHPVRSLPGGKKRPLLIVGFVAAGAGVFLYERRKSAAAAAAAATPTTTDPATDPAYSDPNYQNAYGDGYGSSYGYASTYPYLSSYTDPSTGAVITGAGGINTTTGPGTGQVVLTPTTNAEWSQQCIAFLQAAGFDSAAVATALGKYLSGASVTAAEASIVQAAIGAEGNPPQAVPAVHLTPTPTPKPVAKTPVHLPAPSLSVSSKTTKTAALHWGNVDGNAGYHLFKNGLGDAIWPGKDVTSIVVPRPGNYQLKAIGVANVSYTSELSNVVTV